MSTQAGRETQNMSEDLSLVDPSSASPSKHSKMYQTVFEDSHRLTESQSLIDHVIGKSELDTKSLPQQRSSKRINNKRVKSELIEAISIQCKINSAINIEIRNQNPTYERLQLIIKDLAASQTNIHMLYAHYRDLNDGSEKHINQLIDQLTHDNRALNELAEQSMSKRSAKTQKPTSTRLSHKSSHQSSHRSRSSRSASMRTTSSEMFRMKQLEAAAKAVELEAELQAEASAKEIDLELARLESKKRTLRLQGQLAAERRKAEIFEKALVEEESLSSGLMLPVASHDTIYKVTPMPKYNQNKSPKILNGNDQSLFGQARTVTAQEKKSQLQAMTPKPAGVIEIIDNAGISNNCNLAYELSDDDSDADQELPPPAASLESLSKTVGKPIHSSSSNHCVSSSHSIHDISHITTGLAEAISSAFNMNRLPPPEPFIFNGDPIVYPDWSFAFDNLIGNKQCSMVEKLHYLKRYVSGKALEVVDGYFLLQSQDAYHKARADLKKRFGDPFTVSEAFRTKIDCWPVIKNKDHEGLRRFSDFLQQCLTAQDCITQLSILNDNRENKKMVAKLPEYVTRKWVRTVTNYTQKHDEFPKFAAFCKFLSKEAEVACNPLFSEMKPPEHKQNEHKKVYATQQQGEAKGKNESNRKQCTYCHMSNHTTTECGKINWLPFAEQHQFLKNNHLCFACLDGKHGYKQCTSPAICKTCKGEHPSSLHRLRTTSQEHGPTLEKAAAQPEKPPNSQTVAPSNNSQ